MLQLPITVMDVCSSTHQDNLFFNLSCDLFFISFNKSWLKGYSMNIFENYVISLNHSYCTCISTFFLVLTSIFGMFPVVISLSWLLLFWNQFYWTTCIFIWLKLLLYLLFFLRGWQEYSWLWYENWWCNEIKHVEFHFSCVYLLLNLASSYHVASGDFFKSACKLFLKSNFNFVLKMYIFWYLWIYRIFCVKFQRVPLKFHTKYFTHTLES